METPQRDSLDVPHIKNRNTSSENTSDARLSRSGADLVVDSLLALGVEVLFGYPGGAIMPVYDSLYRASDRLRHILVRHEQGAAHAAEGYARVTGRPGVCIATSGPGATNLVTGIADAMMDSVPLICITGQVPSFALGTEAFQETDIIGVTAPITKWNCQITSAKDIPLALREAYRIAISGRPGPVLIDITKDAQFEMTQIRPETLQLLAEASPRLPLKLTENIRKAGTLINTAKKPLLLVGNGVLLSQSEDLVRELAERADIPVACTLHGLSAFPTAHPLYSGMLGMHGNYAPNILTNEADLIIACGMRFDDRVTGKVSEYAKKAKIIHIDIHADQIGKVVPADIGIVGDLREALAAILIYVSEQRHPEWRETFREADAKEHEKVIADALNPKTPGLRMSEVVSKLSDRSPEDTIVVADVGQHQMMTARYYQFQRTRSFLSSGGLGTMGFALPAAFGAQVGAPDRTVLAIIGDGGFQMTLQELGTIAQENLPVKIVVLNNSYLGMVRQWQQLFFEKRYSFVDLKNPDFVKLCDAYGIAGERVSSRSELSHAIDTMYATPGPYFLEVVVEKEENVFPMVPSGASVSDIRLE